jgi:hypothetical protein
MKTYNKLKKIKKIKTLNFTEDIIILILGLFSYYYLYKALLKENFKLIVLYFILLLALYIFINKYSFILSFIFLLLNDFLNFFPLKEGNIVKKTERESKKRMNNKKKKIEKIKNKKSKSGNNCEQAIAGHVVNSLSDRDSKTKNPINKNSIDPNAEAAVSEILSPSEITNTIITQ